MTMLITETAAWKSLAAHAAEARSLSLRTLLSQPGRAEDFRVESDGVVLDYSRQLATPQTRSLLLALAESIDLPGKLAAMAMGVRLNTSEDRSVLHMALRASDEETIVVDGENVVSQVHEVLQKIRAFTSEIRSGKRRGASGKPLRDVVAIGIGGSYLGPEFVNEALHTEPNCVIASAGRRLRFLANVDPIDVARALSDLDPASTLVVVVSKTFTTAETMLNARTVRAWLVNKLGRKAVAKHMVAVSTNLPEVTAFGIDPENVFGFWDWVGGRYSVCSAVGMLPLSLQYSFEVMQQFLAGARAMDQHLLSAPMEQNLPVLQGLFGVWNSSFLGYPTRALLPYCQALMRFAPHIQQVDMESNGKRVALDGTPLGFDAGEINFGEPGTNGQHSFYQLVHQGRVVPCDFIGFQESQQPIAMKNEVVANHDELMANFFAQPDALAFGKTAEECASEGVPSALIPHKVFPGNRPSNVLLLERLSPFTCGQLLALYEHRTVVQGFIWGLNSFDQWGVELGKVLAKQVRSQLHASRNDPKTAIAGFNPSTTAMLARYLKGPREALLKPAKASAKARSAPAKSTKALTPKRPQPIKAKAKPVQAKRRR
jgi:glucose-6-phosphate isomerase